MLNATTENELYEVEGDNDMTGEIQIFNFNGSETRVIERDGQPWWVAKDICDVLGLGNTTEALRGLDEDELSSELMKSGGQGREMSIVNEPGLYSLILRSRKPEAKSFKRWITHEVLPAIRRHGGYLTPQKVEEALLDPDTIIKLATDLKAERERRRALEAKSERDAPKVLFADSVASSHTDILIGDLAKLLRQNGVEVGQRRLFDWLRDKGYLIRQKGLSWNMPTQRAMELELFRVKETTINKPDGSVQISKTTKVTGKGQIYFIEKFLGEKAAEAVA